MDERSERDRLTAGIRLAIGNMNGSKLSKARQLGVSPNTIDRWTSGASRPSESNLARLARASGIDQEEIRSGRIFAPEER